MGFNTSGFVLKSARSAPSNAVTTAGTNSGVSRAHADLPGDFVFPGTLVEVAADSYRVAISERPGGGVQEYLFWAANTSNLAVLEDPSWAVSTGTGNIPVGSLSVVSGLTTYTDGTDRIVVADVGNRSLVSVLSVTLIRGDVPGTPIVVPFGDFASQNADAGIVVLGEAVLVALGGGLSVERGDAVVGVSYYIAAQKFWWTRNDPYVRRFGWDGLTQRWMPLKGSPPSLIGSLREGVSYVLEPRPTRFAVGSRLPGDPMFPDARAMVRIGSVPDATSTPQVVDVVSDEDAATSYSFPPGVDAVVGVGSGVLQWNPVTLTANVGREAWYVQETFIDGSDGVLGSLSDAGTDPLFVVPVPEPTGRPLIRFGSRKHLSTVATADDAALALLVVSEGTVGWSASTGKLKFSVVDVEKADPDAAGFDRAYIGAAVISDGVALTQEPVGTTRPVQLVDAAGSPAVVSDSGDLFVPAATSLPEPGISGVWLVPDGTGMIPDPAIVPGTRPNGSGLLREIQGDGDCFFFGRVGATSTTEIVEFESDLPAFAFRIPRGTAFVARELDVSGAGSKVALSRTDRRLFSGLPLYFLQASVQPQVFMRDASIYSKIREPFVLDGSEVFTFAIDGVAYSWSALGAGSYDAATLASSLDSVVTGTGSVTAVSGHILISSGSLATGSVEIGFGSAVSGAYANRDLSGCCALGFLPGWRVDDPSVRANWLSDSGFSMGVFRSPQNLDMSQGIPDFVSRGQFRDAVLSERVPASPVFFVTNPPLLDVAGYDDGVFFQLVDGLYRRNLRPLEDVAYDFERGRFLWTEQQNIVEGIAYPTTSLYLGATGVLEDTLHPAVREGNGLYLDDAGAPFVLQVLGEDYVLDQDGNPGTVTLVERVGSRVAIGSRGAFTGNGFVFTDPNATFVADGVVANFRLKLTGGPSTAQGSYDIASVDSETTLTVVDAVPFPASGTLVGWEVYAGGDPSAYDLGLWADVIYEPFDHLSSEPFVIRVLSRLGLTPANPVDQASDRLVAVVSDALEHGRTMSIRFGLASDAPTAMLSVLTTSRLGVIANGTLIVPDVADPHFSSATFNIVVGSVSYITGVNLTGVSVFTEPLVGDQVEYGLPLSGIAGQLKFGEDTLVDGAESYVHYVQVFSDPGDLIAGTAEVEPILGEINLSSSDMSDYAGIDAYFDEQMVSEGRVDVVVSPMHGAISFNRPLREFQVVEATYYQADVAGSRSTDALIVELLPLFVRLEVATAVSPLVFSINPTGRTIRTDIPIQVWVDGRLQNYGNVTDVRLDGDVLRFTAPVASSAVVLVNYAVVHAFGGEQGFTVAHPPVYRPPFFLQKDVPTFDLDSDRTQDLLPGKLLRVGANPFYVKTAVYDPSSDTTRVTIFPTPKAEVGSRAPGNDVLSLVSSVPVALTVDGVPTLGSSGFLLLLEATYEPVDPGMLSIVFHGDVSQFTVAGHLLEVGGHPFVIAGCGVSSEGLTTEVHVTSPFTESFSSLTNAVFVSARPIYPPNAREFVGASPIVVGEPFEVVLFGEKDAVGMPLPGRTLVDGRDFSLDDTSGKLILLSPTQSALRPGQRLVLSYTRLRRAAPFFTDGLLTVPRYKAGYTNTTTPNLENKFLGAFLVATYSFSSPDTFYIRAVPVVDWMGEVAQIAVSRVASRTPHGGPVVVSGPPTNNWEFGTIPILSQVRELQDQDRAARVFISLYDAYAQAFEQVLETMSGDVVGDRDGKFRFFVGRGKVYGGPGYEDIFSGLLQSRFVWSQVFEAANGQVSVTNEDPLVDPETAVQDPTTRVVSGDPMNPWLIDFYVEMQRNFILNDMDDTVLVGKDRARLSFPFAFVVRGLFRQVWEPSVLSRIYPESALAFTTTYPGIGAGTLPGEAGVYSFLKVTERPRLMRGSGPVFGSTFGMDIGDVSNPALGLITNITGQVRPRVRLARARVWAYSPVGFPDIDPATDGKPSVIATPLYLKDFPIDPSSGLPDTTRLAANGGDLLDLTTGDYELSTPPWAAYDDAEGIIPQIAIGRPTGETSSVGFAAGTITDAFSGAFPFTTPVYKGIFVGGVYAGCVLTFTDGSGTEITDASDIILIEEDGTSTRPFNPGYGDTILVIPPGSSDASGFADPPSVADLRKFASRQPVLDTSVRERRSSFVDRSLPSVADPAFPIKEIVNQRTANPLQPIEADVEFASVRRTPLEFPALRGSSTNDDGDFTLPYLSAVNTEIERLGAAQAGISAIIQTDGPLVSHPWLAVYPDELIGNDGSIAAVAVGSTPPATILTSVDLTPVATAGVYTAHSGVGDVRRFDLLLVETGQAGIEDGLEGILTVGDVTANTLEPPRFVSQTALGMRIRYTISSAMVHLTSTGVTGAVLQENGGLTTTFDVGSVSGLVLNDGSGLATGGLNNIVGNAIFAFPNNNIITIDVLDSGSGLVVETLTLQGSSVTGGLGTVVIGGAPTFTNTVMTIAAVGFVDFAALGGAAPGPVGPFDFRISVDTYVAPATPLTGSATARVAEDRLTFEEGLDLRSMRPRGAVTVGGVSVEGALSVHNVSASGVSACTVNSPAVVNGGSAFTFLARDSGFPDDVGSFDPSPGTGFGSVKVMAVEGSGNVSLPSVTSFTFSAIASSDQDASGPILEGVGIVFPGENRVRPVIPSAGSLSNVVAGDILIIQTSSIGDAAVSAGSYVIRHAVSDDGAGYAEVFPVSPAGNPQGWLQTSFPRVVSASPIPFELVVTGIQVVSSSPSGFDFPASGRVFIIPNSSDATTILSAAYGSFAVAVNGEVTFSLIPGSVRDASGALGPSDVDFTDAAVVDAFVSGMTYCQIGALPSPMPSNNVVGFDSGGVTVGGFVCVTLAGAAGSHTFTAGVDLVNALTAPPTPTQFGIAPADSGLVNDSTSFVSDRTTPVYQDVPVYADLTGIDDPADAPTVALWETIHGAGLGGASCLIPWMRLFGSDASATPGMGFRGQSGVFIEPSMPRPVTDLGNGEVKVVDSGNTAVATDRIGMRSPTAFGLLFFETVAFSVRRVRRFHDVLDEIGDNLAPLRFAYETRRGTVVSYVHSTFTLEAVGTQLGGFDDVDVNVNPGDEIRIMDGTTVIDSAEIASVISATEVRLRAPGLAVALPIGGELFQVYLKQAPVPHTQSNAQLLDLLTEQVVLDRTRDPVGDTGGRSDVFGELRDNGIPDFSALDPAPLVGDIVLVDPAEALEGATGSPVPPEYGARPFGDQSVSIRLDGSHVAGSPSDLDDNRGWYRIVVDPATTQSFLSVSGETIFSGSGGSPVIFGAAATGQQFAVLPDVTASVLTGGTEGQMALRPTKAALPSNSYQDGSFKSIEPFSYRIIRPTGIISRDTVDTILLMRERVLSWVEKMTVAMGARKQGSYFIFQADQHVSDIGSTTDVADGLGMPSNLFLTSLSGLTQIAPFANTSDCLSILDRRYWCLDTRLDREQPPYSMIGDPYSSFEEDVSVSGYTVGSGRPVGPDRIREILDASDRIRALRFAWIKFRANQENGTLPQIQRFIADLPRLLQEQQDLLNLQQSFRDAE